MTKYLIVYLTIIMAVFGIHNLSTDIDTTVNTKNRQYSEYLTTATYDASVTMKNNYNDGKMLGTIQNREQALNTLFNSLSLNFGLDTNNDLSELKYYTPAVALVDTNGYYIAYNVNYKDENGKIRLKSIITDITPWTWNELDDYIVRFYLNDRIDLIKRENYKIYSGTYDEIQKITNNKGVLELLKDDQKQFEKFKSEIIVDSIHNSIEYYINKHNDIDIIHNNYTFTMPHTNTDDWARLLHNPTCIAFLQGIKIGNNSKYLNIYALNGGEITKTGQTIINDKYVNNSVDSAIEKKKKGQ